MIKGSFIMYSLLSISSENQKAKKKLYQKEKQLHMSSCFSFY